MPSFVIHIVLNQVPPLEDYSLFDTDPALGEAAARGGRARRRRGACAGAGRHAGRQAVGLQARDRGGGRMHGGVGRQRLRRRGANAALVPRNAGQFHLGGLGQRHGAGCVAALQREPEALPALEAEFAPALEAEFAPAFGQHREFDTALAQWRALLAEPAQAEFQTRRIACGLARLWQAALLIRHAPEPVARGGVGSRLGAAGGVFGELTAGIDVAAILARAWPAAATC